MRINISYISHNYVSFRKAASVYRQIIGGEYRIVPDLQDAQVVIVHGTPAMLAQIYERNPVLKQRYLIGYYYWEANAIPPVYKSAMTYTDEIWTCSEYCRRIFEQYHPRVTWIPHVVERNDGHSSEEMQFLKTYTRFDPNLFYFFSITKISDRRKNAGALVKAFQHLGREMPEARLILKLPPGEGLCSLKATHVIEAPLQLSDTAINALYELSTVYVSPHHSEGWGFPLSDAMIFKKPVIATGYSGNLEFMNRTNSWLLDFVESQIRPEDCFDLFDQSMKWAYPDGADLEKKMLFLYENAKSDFVAQRVRQASQDILNFDRLSVGTIVLRRLSEICSRYL